MTRASSILSSARWLMPLGVALVLSVGAAVALPRTGLAYNHQNPRWESIDRSQERKNQKQYRPAHLPPEDLPARAHHGLLGGKLRPEERALEGIAVLVILTVAAQWLSASSRLPLPLLLLMFGALAGPVTGVLDPDNLFGNLLLPLVSLGLALMLFLDALAVRELPGSRHRTVRALASIGFLITSSAAIAASYFVLNLSAPLALLLGFIVAITGAATGVAPRPRRFTGALSALLRGERTITGLVGSVLVILVFEGIMARGFRAVPGAAWDAVRNTVIFGLLFGTVGAGLLLLSLRRHWMPRSVERAVPLMLVVAVFAFSNLIQAGAGFVAVITMGMLLGRQGAMVEYASRLAGRWYGSMSAAMFLVLIARIRVDELLHLGMAEALFIVVVALTTRPLAVGVSTLRGACGWRQRVLLTFLAPRGVLAAGLATLCGIRLAETGAPEAAAWAPVALLIVAGTVVTSALAPFAVRRSPVSGEVWDGRSVRA